MNPRQFITLSIAAVASIVLLAVGPVPLGVPGEWVWQRLSWEIGLFDALDRLLIPLLGGVLLFVVAAFWQPRSCASPFRVLGSFTLLVVAGFVWLQCVQQAAPTGHRVLKPYWVLYDPSSAGYFFEATHKIKNTGEFLGGYEARMRQGEVLHIGTHPPGLFLLSKACLNACDSWPSLVKLLNGLENTDTQHAFRLVEAEADYAPRLTENQLAALHLLSMLSRIAVVLTIVPLAVLSRQFFDVATTWKSCCLWPTLPCLAVFMPKSDVMFPLTCTSALVLAIIAMSGGKRLLLAVPAGAILWIGLMMSLAHLPVAVLLAAYAVIRAVISKRKTLTRDAIAGCICVATIFVCCVVWNAITDCNIFNVWLLNLTNHAGFYDQFHRTWYKWILVNPVEQMLSVGVPVFVVASVGVWKAARGCVSLTGNPENNDSSEDMCCGFCLSAGVVIIALWLSGKNQGEAARLWCFLTPWIVVMAGQWLRSQKVDTYWQRILLLQMVVSILTVSRVTGFSF